MVIFLFYFWMHNKNRIEKRVDRSKLTKLLWVVINMTATLFSWHVANRSRFPQTIFIVFWQKKTQPCINCIIYNIFKMTFDPNMCRSQIHISPDIYYYYCFMLIVKYFRFFIHSIRGGHAWSLVISREIIMFMNFRT